MVKMANIKRGYKLRKDNKYEYFYDLLTSELRIHGLLHIIKNETPSDTNENIIEEQKHIVRDIIINHIEKVYHNRIITILEPVEMLKELKIIKSGEVNIDRHTAKRALYEFQYIHGKIKAVKFCEDFENAIRIYENCPGAGGITKKEKREIFFGALQKGAPSIKNLEFMGQQSGDQGLPYSTLKTLLIQEEALQRSAEGNGTP